MPDPPLPIDSRYLDVSDHFDSTDYLEIRNRA